MKNNNTQYMNGRPRSTHFRAVQTIIKNYQINPETGQVFNQQGLEVGNYTYEPRVTVRVDGKKYNARLNKVMGYVKFGPEALRRGVQVKHRDGDKFNNGVSNLELVYSLEAARTLRKRTRNSRVTVG